MHLEDQILLIIRNNTEKKMEVTLASDLRNDLRLDSFGTLMIINAVEEKFGVTIDDGDVRALKTVSDVVAMLREKYHCV